MKFLEESFKNGVATVEINRPKALNALNKEMLKELLALIQSLEKKKAKALILTGSGEKAFIAGADIKEMHLFTAQEYLEFCSLGQQVADALESAKFLTAAAVNGYALGGGFEIAIACDLIFAKESAIFGLPEVSLGLIPGFGGTQRLARTLGMKMAKKWILSGAFFTTEEVEKMGLVYRVVKEKDFLFACEKQVLQLLENPFPSLVQAKLIINESDQMFLKHALELERNISALCFDTPEAKQAIKAFTEKSR